MQTDVESASDGAGRSGKAVPTGTWPQLSFEGRGGLRPEGQDEAFQGRKGYMPSPKDAAAAVRAWEGRELARGWGTRSGRECGLRKGDLHTGLMVGPPQRRARPCSVENRDST